MLTELLVHSELVLMLEMCASCAGRLTILYITVNANRRNPPKATVPQSPQLVWWFGPEIMILGSF